MLTATPAPDNHGRGGRALGCNLNLVGIYVNRKRTNIYETTFTWWVSSAFPTGPSSNAWRSMSGFISGTFGRHKHGQRFASPGGAVSGSYLGGQDVRASGNVWKGRFTALKEVEARKVPKGRSENWCASGENMNQAWRAKLSTGRHGVYTYNTHVEFPGHGRIVTATKHIESPSPPSSKRQSTISDGTMLHLLNVDIPHTCWSYIFFAAA